MRGQKGQSLVEFALIVPLVLLIIMGMIYGGFAYADYLQYGSAVRDAARDIAVQDDKDRAAIKAGLNGNSPAMVNKYVNPYTGFYTPDFSVSERTEINSKGRGVRFVTVKVKLSVTDDSGYLKLLPKDLAELECTMPMEELEEKDDTDSGENNEDNSNS